MGILDSLGSLFSTPPSIPQTITNVTRTEIPEFIEKGGEEIFNFAKPVAGREFPFQPTEFQLAPFNQDQTNAFEMTRGNIGSWANAFLPAFQMTGASGTQLGGKPGDFSALANAGSLDQYLNPHTKEVIDTTVAELNRQYERDANNRFGQLAKFGALNPPRQVTMEMQARENMDRVIGEVSGRLRSQGFQTALTARENELQRLRLSGRDMSDLARQRSQLGFTDAAALGTVGGAQQTQEQQRRTLNYDQFLKEFFYPQEQISYLTSILQGIPYSTGTTSTGTQLVPQANAFATGLGAIGALLTGVNSFRPAGT